MLTRAVLLSLFVAGLTPQIASAQAAKPAPAAAPATAPAQKVLASAPTAAPAMTPEERMAAAKKRTLDMAAAGQCDEAKELAMRIGDKGLAADVDKACTK